MSDATDLRIRDAHPGDRDVIVAFNRALARETEEKVLDPSVLTLGVELALEAPDRLRYWVAERDGEIVGQAAISREWSDWRCGWIWWFQSVYVRPQDRGRGVFRTLHAHIRGLARASRDVIGLRLYVERENRRAQDTYAALGLRPGGYLVFEELWITGGEGMDWSRPGGRSTRD
ncbi:GNAT family N-acetyltransferase [Tautonia sociabilis]|uniref:GNAT family N-acetyltransferase n=1 Tax=Tautonia sociabilis TaxID=2080755 RepID=A0A432MH16_9BACT|nr:GNAT family N-acetyltransferase [Tautonia sociabilis]RUL86126.1 GNAT family N-acetyltransferase [Tautonia sociabilis]